MAIQTVGILSPGDMGQAIAGVLIQHGLRTVAALDNRSERTRQLATEAKIEDVGSLNRLVCESDVLLSVLVPACSYRSSKAGRRGNKQRWQKPPVCRLQCDLTR